MKCSDIIRQMYSAIPSFSSLFTDEITITSITASSGTATVTTSSPHGLISGQYVFIANTIWGTPVSSIAVANNIATVTTSIDHDLTEVWNKTCSFSGCSVSQYNGTFPLLSVPNRRTFTFLTPAPHSPVSADSTLLLETDRQGFQGWYQITVTGPSTFTYFNSFLVGTPAGTGNMVLRYNPRISGAVSIQKAIDSYTQYSDSKLYAFVVLGRTRADISKHSTTTAYYAPESHSVYRQNLISHFDIYVFTPSQNSVAGREARDLMVDVGIVFYKSILGISFPTYLVDEPSSTCSFLEDEYFSYQNSYYIHRFKFEYISQITNNDIFQSYLTRSFRDLDLNIDNIKGVPIIENAIDLDDQPL